MFAPELRGVVLQTAPHEDDGVAHAARVAVVEDTDPHPRDSVAAGKSLEHREQILHYNDVFTLFTKHVLSSCVLEQINVFAL